MHSIVQTVILRSALLLSVIRPKVLAQYLVTFANIRLDYQSLWIIYIGEVC